MSGCSKDANALRESDRCDYEYSEEKSPDDIYYCDRKASHKGMHHAHHRYEGKEKCVRRWK